MKRFNLLNSHPRHYPHLDRYENPIAFNAFFCSRRPNRFQYIMKFMAPDMTAAKIDGTSMAAAPPSRVKVVQTIHTRAIRLRRFGDLRK